MTSLRDKLVKLAFENPELRADILPVLAAGKEAGFKETLQNLWKGYKKEHPKSEKPPESLIEQAKKDSGEGEKKAPTETAEDKKKRLQEETQKAKVEKAKAQEKLIRDEEDKKKTKSKEDKDEDDKEHEEDKESGYADSEGYEKPHDRRLRHKKEDTADSEKTRRVQDEGGDLHQHYNTAPDRAGDRKKEKEKRDKARSEHKSKKGSLRDKLVKLAFENPKLRPHLLPILAAEATKPLWSENTVLSRVPGAKAIWTRVNKVMVSVPTKSGTRIAFLTFDGDSVKIESWTETPKGGDKNHRKVVGEFSVEEIDKIVLKALGVK